MPTSGIKGQQGRRRFDQQKDHRTLAKENNLSDIPDFNDAAKLGSGKEMVDRLTNLIAIIEDKAFDFSKNRADGDDILGENEDEVESLFCIIKAQREY
jgi:hypothetical protein